MKKLFILLFSIVSLVSYSQEIEQDWSFSSIKKNDGKEFIKTDSTDVFNLKDGKFTYSLKGKDNLKASGNYIHQNNLLIFNFKEPKDTVRYFNIVSFNTANLVLSENDVIYNLSSKGITNIANAQDEANLISDAAATSEEKSSVILPSQGFSINTL
ncbi:MAG: CNT family concentrative nucleoside transporter, partial [Maribacter sp.]